MKRNRLLFSFLENNPNLTDEELEVCCNAVFAKDDKDRYVSNNISELSQTMELFF